MAASGIKRIGGIVAGVVSAGIVVALLEAAGHMIYPPPAGLDISNPADQERLLSVIPFGAKLSVVIAWFLGALVGPWIAVRISGWAATAWVIGGVMVALSVISTQMFPHPLWMVIAALALPLAAAWLALRLRTSGKG